MNSASAERRRLTARVARPTDSGTDQPRAARLLAEARIRLPGAILWRPYRACRERSGPQQLAWWQCSLEPRFQRQIQRTTRKSRHTQIQTGWILSRLESQQEDKTRHRTTGQNQTGWNLGAQDKTTGQNQTGWNLGAQIQTGWICGPATRDKTRQAGI